MQGCKGLTGHDSDASILPVGVTCQTPPPESMELPELPYDSTLINCTGPRSEPLANDSSCHEHQVMSESGSNWILDGGQSFMSKITGQVESSEDGAP